MNSKTRNLGAIGQMLDRARTKGNDAAQKEYVIISIDRIAPQPGQPRKTFPEDTLNELASSIREHGVLEPLIVLPENDGIYHLVSGERRWRASQIAGRSEVPCVIRDISAENLLVIQIIENIQREDLPALEEADSVNRLVEMYGNQNVVAEKLGRKKDYVSKMVTAACLPARAREAFACGVIRDVESLNHVSRIYKTNAAFGDQLVALALENDGVTRAYTASMLKRAKDNLPPLSPSEWAAEASAPPEKQSEEDLAAKSKKQPGATGDAGSSTLRRKLCVLVAVPGLSIDCAELVFDHTDEDPDAIWACAAGELVRVDGHDVRILKAEKA